MIILNKVIIGIGVVAIVALSNVELIAQHTGTTDRNGAMVSGSPDNIRRFSVNGVSVILRPTSDVNRVIAVKLFIRGGLAVLPKDVSPAIEPLSVEVPVLSGPQNVDKGAFRRSIDRMVTKIDATAGRDFTTVNMRCVDEQFEPSWDLFSGILMRPQYDEAELRNAKQRALVGIRNRLVSPESYATFVADSVFFVGHPYGRYAKESDISGITEPVLRAYYRSIMVKSRLLLVVVGNVDSAALSRKIAATFGTLPEGMYHEYPLPIPRNANKPSVTVRTPIGGQPITTNYIVARYLAPNRSDQLYYPMLRLTSFMSGSLFREVRIERNLSYAPDADATFCRTSYGEVTVSTTLPDSAWRVSKREVLDFFRDNVIPDEYMHSGIASWTTNNYVRQQTSASQANELGLAEIYTGNWMNAFGTVDGMKSVTPESMNKAAQRYLRNFTIVIIGNPKSVTQREFLSAVETDRGKDSNEKSTSTGKESGGPGDAGKIDWSK